MPGGRRATAAAVQRAAAAAGRRRRLTRDGLDQATTELGRQQAVDDEVDARVDVDEQLGGRLQVEHHVTTAVPRLYASRT